LRYCRKGVVEVIDGVFRGNQGLHRLYKGSIELKTVRRFVSQSSLKLLYIKRMSIYSSPSHGAAILLLNVADWEAWDRLFVNLLGCFELRSKQEQTAETA
jgi:hypothetical protein